MSPVCDFDADFFHPGAALNETFCSLSSASLAFYPTYLVWAFGIIFALSTLYTLWSIIDAKRSRPRLLFTRWVLAGLAWAGFLITADFSRSLLEEIVPAIAGAIREISPLAMFPLGLLMGVIVVGLYGLIPAAWIDFLGRLGRSSAPLPKAPKTTATPSDAALVASDDFPRWGGR